MRRTGRGMMSKPVKRSKKPVLRGILPLPRSLKTTVRFVPRDDVVWTKRALATLALRVYRDNGGGGAPILRIIDCPIFPFLGRTQR